MPRGDADQFSNLFIMLYGPPKHRKTWWALAAAEAGFNVHLLDGDKGGKIVQQLSPQARKRVNIINCFDTNVRAIFADIVVRFIKNEHILWDDTDNKYMSIMENTCNPEHNYYHFCLDHMGPNDVVVLDSVKALVYSVAWRHLKDNGIDITELQKQDWDLYNFLMLLLNTVLTRLRSAGCHVVVISHEEVNELTEPKKKDDGKIERVSTGEVQTQPMSSSRKHGNIMGNFFDEFLHFEMSGYQVMIDSRPREGVQAGSRSMHGIWTWENMSFATLAAKNGFKGNWDVESKGCIYYPGGENGLKERPGMVRKQVAVPKPAEGVKQLGQPAPVANGEPPKITISLRK